MRQNLKLLLTTLLVCLLLTEIGFRINGKYISYAERTGGEYSSPFQQDNLGWTHTLEPFVDVQDEKAEFTTRWISNNEGLNNPVIALEKTGKRVLVFGDGFVESVGAPNDSSYPRILEKLLQASSDTTLQVINCGISGADIFPSINYWYQKWLSISPIMWLYASTHLIFMTLKPEVVLNGLSATTSCNIARHPGLNFFINTAS
ncbi:MAG: hypothetical protein U0T74_01845 [Chitinophagales bacterium]